MRHWRKMTWAIIAWSALMLIWIIVGTNAADCGSKTGAQKSGCEAGAGIGIAGLMFLWFIGFVVLALIWFMTRPRDRGGPTVSGPQYSAPPVVPTVPPGWHPDPDPQGPQGRLRWWDGRQWTDRTSAR